MRAYLIPFVILAALGAASQVFAFSSSVCGPDDSRAPSDFKPIGRTTGDIMSPGGCTATLISNRCVISAGHCNGAVKFTEFNVPDSMANGRPQLADPIYRFKLDRIINFQNARKHGGYDWMVYRLQPNELTGRTAGETQGYYPVELKPFLFLSSDQVRISGYGRAKGRQNYTQQSAVGPVLRKSGGSKLYHRVDTMPANSGSAIILEKTQKIVGIHIVGDCSVDGDSNLGTWIANTPPLVGAIKQCLALEE